MITPEMLEVLDKLPLYLDGSGDSMWLSRSDVATAMQDMDGSATRCYIKLSDLLAALEVAEKARI